MDGDRELEVEAEHGRAQRRGRSVATAGLVTGTIVLLGVVPACGSPSRPAADSATTSTTVASDHVHDGPAIRDIRKGSAAEIADCEADSETVETALEAYMAEKGAYPTPPAPWSAGTYAADYGPLTSGGGGDTLLHTAPSDKYYVIEYDSSGHVWVAPPGRSVRRTTSGRTSGANQDICDAGGRISCHRSLTQARQPI